VLQSETGSLSGGDHRWFKRSTSEKLPVTRDNIIIIIIIIIINVVTLTRSSLFLLSLSLAQPLRSKYFLSSLIIPQHNMAKTF
jgi:hypothetical protein